MLQRRIAFGAVLFLSAIVGQAQVINETFSSSPASNFTVVSGGTWSVTGGKYVLTSPVAGGTGNNNISTHNTSLTGDWTLTVEGSTTATASAWNDFSIIFGYQNATNYYYFSSNESNDGGTSGIMKVTGGTVTQLADITSPITGGTIYTAQIVKTGSTYQVYRNSVLLASATDSSWSSGKVGFGTLSDGATFDNLVVTGGVVSNPVFSPAPGSYSSTQSVTITSATSGATIRYTTNGTTPTPTVGTIYTGPVSIGTTSTLKAIAYKSGMTNSSVTSGAYTIGLTHGNQVTRYNVGARLNMYAAGIDTRPQATPTTISGFTHSSGTATYTDKIITGRVRVTGGTLILNNCWIQMPVNTSPSYHGLHINGGICEFQDLTITQPNYDSMGILVNGGGLKGQSILILGAEDSIHVNNEVGSGSLAFPTHVDPNYPDFTGARVVLTDGYFGDRYAEGGRHADNLQIDGGGRLILKRINLQAHKIIWPAIPPATQWGGNPADISSGGVIMTQNSANPRQIDNVGIYDCNFDGGNVTVDTNPSDGLPVANAFLRGNTWGSSDAVTGGYVAIYRFSPLSTGTGTTKTNNTWLQTGLARKVGNNNTPPADVPVTAGAAIP